MSDQQGLLVASDPAAACLCIVSNNGNSATSAVSGLPPVAALDSICEGMGTKTIEVVTNGVKRIIILPVGSCEDDVTVPRSSLSSVTAPATPYSENVRPPQNSIVDSSQIQGRAVFPLSSAASFAPNSVPQRQQQPVSARAALVHKDYYGQWSAPNNAGITNSSRLTVYQTQDPPSSGCIQTVGSSNLPFMRSAGAVVPFNNTASYPNLNHFSGINPVRTVYQQPAMANMFGAVRLPAALCNSTPTQFQQLTNCGQAVTLAQQNSFVAGGSNLSQLQALPMNNVIWQNFLTTSNAVDAQALDSFNRTYPHLSAAAHLNKQSLQTTGTYVPPNDMLPNVAASTNFDPYGQQLSAQRVDACGNVYATFPRGFSGFPASASSALKSAPQCKKTVASDHLYASFRLNRPQEVNRTASQPQKAKRTADYSSFLVRNPQLKSTTTPVRVVSNKPRQQQPTDLAPTNGLVSYQNPHMRPQDSYSQFRVAAPKVSTSSGAPVDTRLVAVQSVSVPVSTFSTSLSTSTVLTTSSCSTSSSTTPVATASVACAPISCVESSTASSASTATSASGAPSTAALASSTSFSASHTLLTQLLETEVGSRSESLKTCEAALLATVSSHSSSVSCNDDARSVRSTTAVDAGVPTCISSTASNIRNCREPSHSPSSAGNNVIDMIENLPSDVFEGAESNASLSELVNMLERPLSATIGALEDAGDLDSAAASVANASGIPEAVTSTSVAATLDHSYVVKSALQMARSIGKGMHHVEEEKDRRRQQQQQQQAERPRRSRRKQQLTNLDYDDACTNSSESWHPDEFESHSTDKTPSSAEMSDCVSSTSWSSEDSVTIGKQRKQQQQPRRRRRTGAGGWGWKWESRERMRRRKQKLMRQRTSSTSESVGRRAKRQKEDDFTDKCRTVAPQAVASDETFQIKQCTVNLERINIGRQLTMNVHRAEQLLCCHRFTLTLSTRWKRRRLESDDDDDDGGRGASVSDGVNLRRCGRAKVPRIEDSDDSS